MVNLYKSVESHEGIVELQVCNTLVRPRAFRGPGYTLFSPLNLQRLTTTVLTIVVSKLAVHCEPKNV